MRRARRPPPRRPRPPAPPTLDVQSVTVTGIRASLDTSLALKRDAHGIVDGITAEDVGKFPDTNLAEAMQRISGVSIDRVGRRRLQDHGARLRARLQHDPAERPPDAGDARSRLPARPTRARSTSPTSRRNRSRRWKSGRPARPRSRPAASAPPSTSRRRARWTTRACVASFGVKGVMDESNKRLPDDDKGKNLTPELSGIYSNTFADHTVRRGAHRQLPGARQRLQPAGVTSGWHTFNGRREQLGHDPAARRAGLREHHQPPRPERHCTGAAEHRLRGQRHPSRAHQRPADAAVAAGAVVHRARWTTRSRRTASTPRRSDLSSWFNFGPSISSWTNGPVAGPNFYSETIDAATAPADIAMGGGWFGVKTTLRSLGLNLDWKPSDKLQVRARRALVQFDLGLRQPLRHQRRPGHRQLQPRHHDGRLLARLPGDEHRRRGRARRCSRSRARRSATAT